MKKFIIIAVALIVTLNLVGCGANNESPIGGNSTTSEETSTTSTDESTSSESTASTKESISSGENIENFVIELPEVLQRFNKIAVENLPGTNWQIVGAMDNGIELDDTDLDELNEMLGGTFTLSFQDDTKVNISAGENFTEAVYVLSDNSSISIENENAMSSGVFVNANGVPTLLMAHKDSPETILYMRQIDEI